MWSAQQQSMLNAMGYTLYVRPGLHSASVPIEVPQANVNVPANASDSALFKAIMKAAQGRDIAQLGIDIHRLRSSPQAKRDLWPQLRRLMKS